MQRLGVPYEITNDLDALLVYKGPKINYSTTPIEGSLHVFPTPLLFTDSIEVQQISVTNEKWWKKIFFQSKGDIPFDVFAAAFYLLSRYEEYLPAEHDHHNRYSHKNSCAFINDFLDIPLVDIWALQLKWQFETHFNFHEFNLPKFSFVSTIDIDFAFRYRGIGYTRYWLKLFNELFHFRLKTVIEQINVGISYKNDPYDTYDWIRKIGESNKIEVRYFALLCNGTEYDKNILPYNDVMRNLIQKLSQQHAIGLHPSYNTSENIDLLQHEKSLLDEYTEKKSNSSRQHFLRYTLPETYNQLIDNGITDEYSVGYSALPGFRASTSHPFKFFNVEKNKTYPLTLHPISIMDVNYKKHLEATPQFAFADIEKRINEVKKVNGTFISLWHNSNLSHHEGWLPWKEVFRKMHTLAASKQQQEID